MAEHHGYLYDDRLFHPPPGSYEGQLEANERRFRVWEREEALGRGELYLRLKKLDLENLDEILEFVSTFGVLDVRALDAPRGVRQWFGTVHDQAVPFGALLHYPGFGNESPKTALDSSLREPVVAISASQRAAAPTWTISETLEEFRWGASAICDLHTAWICLRHGEDPQKASWRNTRMLVAFEHGHVEYRVRDFLESTMRIALEGFSPRMWITDATGRAGHRSVASPAPQDLTLFEVLVLELFRHMSEDAAFKTCENESCGRTFVRQEGGSVHGQSRMKGVRYCSRLCAKAVAQRRYRRRKKHS